MSGHGEKASRSTNGVELPAEGPPLLKGSPLKAGKIEDREGEIGRHGYPRCGLQAICGGRLLYAPAACRRLIVRHQAAITPSFIQTEISEMRARQGLIAATEAGSASSAASTCHGRGPFYFLKGIAARSRSPRSACRPSS